MAVYYNEYDPFAAKWLRELINKGLLPDGEIDTRSIADVEPGDLRGFTQHHFFAGIGGWPYALRLAGWPEDRPVWTGSCPCQPFSVAGKGKGTSDERHLWPEFYRLIRECRPSIVFGEQVASRAGRDWLAGVFADVEGVGYAGAGADMCAAGIGAPHIRQRLYWVAQDVGLADGARWNARELAAEAARHGHPAIAGGGGCVVAYAESIGRGRRAHDEDEGRREQPSSHPCEGSSDVADAASRGQLDTVNNAISTKGMGAFQFEGNSRGGNVGDADDAGREGRQLLPERADEFSTWSRGVEWRRGADGKERRVKSGVRLLVDGFPSRVGLLRGFGNAIVPQVAAKFVESIMDIIDGASQ